MNENIVYLQWGGKSIAGGTEASVEAEATDVHGAEEVAATVAGEDDEEAEAEVVIRRRKSKEKSST